MFILVCDYINPEVFRLESEQFTQYADKELNKERLRMVNESSSQ